MSLDKPVDGERTFRYVSWEGTVLMIPFSNSVSDFFFSYWLKEHFENLGMLKFKASTPQTGMQFQKRVLDPNPQGPWKPQLKSPVLCELKHMDSSGHFSSFLGWGGC